MAEGDIPRVLCAGLCCLDLVSVVRAFPSEDDDVRWGSLSYRCLQQQWERGGNASNDCTVLSQLGAKVSFIGTLPKGRWLSFLEDDFAACNVDISNCPQVEGECPTSVVLLSAATGSRTIVHHNQGFPELSSENLKQVPVDHYDWIHFEGRNIDNLQVMIRELKGRLGPDSGTKVSVELEKTRPELLELLPLADVAFVGKELASHMGHTDMKRAAVELQQNAGPNTVVVVPWGEMGAAACDQKGTLVHSIPYPPDAVVDSLGAGDTFVAGTIYALACKLPLRTAVEFGCRIAGAKVGLHGLKCLGDAALAAKKSVGLQ